MVGGDPVLVLQQQLQIKEGKEVQGLSWAILLLWGTSRALPSYLVPSSLWSLTLCVLTSSPTVMYTMGLATATMSEYSSIVKRSSGSGTWQALQINFLSPE
jgi:hypothetical protein